MPQRLSEPVRSLDERYAELQHLRKRLAAMEAKRGSRQTDQPVSQAQEELLKCEPARASAR
jgi:hypothetical protein